MIGTTIATPAETLRERLAELRADGWEFDHAWLIARHEAAQGSMWWLACWRAQRHVWQASYERRDAGPLAALTAELAGEDSYDDSRAVLIT